MRRSLSPGVMLGIVAIVLAMAGSATAGALITSGKIKDGTIQSRDIRKGAINLDRLAPSVRAALAKAGQVGAKGDKGDTGLSGTTLQSSAPQKGDKGDKGDPGDAAKLPSAGHWGIINRNTIGSPNASLRSGPFTPPAGLGTGSLNLSVPSGTEKVAYGNEIDFAGRSVAGLTKVGFYVYNVGENGGGGNMPGITFEIDPNRADVDTSYSSLVFMPDSSPANEWSPYIDGTTSGKWGLTGGKFNTPATQANCGINGPRCTWTEMLAYLDDGGDPATISSVAVTKGRDNAWQGAVDGLTINTELFDFEEYGVFTR